MTDSFAKASEENGESSALQPDMQSVAGIGDVSEPVPRCQAHVRGPRTSDGKGWQKGRVCGAGPHPTKPGFCKGMHPMPGNQLARTQERPVKDAPIDPSAFDGLEMLKQDAIGLSRQATELDATLAGALTRPQRRKYRKERRETSAELREVLREIERLEREQAHHGRAQRTGWLQELPNDIFYALHGVMQAATEFLDGRPYVLPGAEADPKPAAPDLSTQSTAAAPPAESEISKEQTSRLQRVDGGILPGPMLARGNRPVAHMVGLAPPPAAMEGPHQIIEGRPVVVRSGEPLPDPNGEVRNLPLDGSFICNRTRKEGSDVVLREKPREGVPNKEVMYSVKVSNSEPVF